MRHLILTILVLGLLASAATAQVTNGSFTGGLTGWATTTTGYGTVVADGFGSPANSARISANPPMFAWPAGTGSVSQSFGCGSSFENGYCMIALDYYFLRNGEATALFAVKIDGNEVYSNVHTANENGFIPLSFTAPCGLHTIEVTGSYLSGASLTNWGFWVDNVTAECVPVVPEEEASWGSIKAGYR